MLSTCFFAVHESKSRQCGRLLTRRSRPLFLTNVKRQIAPLQMCPSTCLWWEPQCRSYTVGSPSTLKSQFLNSSTINPGASPFRWWHLSTASHGPLPSPGETHIWWKSSPLNPKKAHLFPLNHFAPPFTLHGSHLHMLIRNIELKPSASCKQV